MKGFKWHTADRVAVAHMAAVVVALSAGLTVAACGLTAAVDRADGLLQLRLSASSSNSPQWPWDANSSASSPRPLPEAPVSDPLSADGNGNVVSLP